VAEMWYFGFRNVKPALHEQLYWTNCMEKLLVAELVKRFFVIIKHKRLYYCVHENSLPVPILRQINPIHIPHLSKLIWILDLHLCRINSAHSSHTLHPRLIRFDFMVIRAFDEEYIPHYLILFPRWSQYCS
jgi:hypothetical protein